MQRFTTARLLSASCLLGLAGTAFAADTVAATPDVQQQLSDLKATVQAQQSEIQELKGQKSENWLNEQRSAEVKELVKEVLADADTRTSLMATGVTAGHNGSNFFLASEDNTFMLRILGQLQARYVYNFRQTANTSPTEGNESGFQLRRAKLAFEGYIGSPKIEFKMQAAFDRDSSYAEMDEGWMSYEAMDGLKVFGGRFADRFARESMMSSKYQQTADRSAIANIWAGNDDYVEGAGVEWKALPDYLMVAGTVNDGLNSGTPRNVVVATVPQQGFQNNGGHDFANDSTAFALTARVDGKILGDWKSASDVESWSSIEGPQLFVGAAVHYEVAKSGDNQSGGFFTVGPSGAPLHFPYDSFVQWTGDTLFKMGGFSLMAAGYGWHFYDVNNPTASASSPATNKGVNQQLDLYAAEVQAGYFVIPDKFEPFARYEYITVDDALATNDLNIVTGGANYFFKKHQVKLTTDVMWALNNVNSANTLGTSLTGIGLLSDDANRHNQVVIRTQVQLLF